MARRSGGVVIQAEPWHWRWQGDPSGPHHPKRCLLCWAERVAVRLRLARYEED